MSVSASVHILSTLSGTSASTILERGIFLSLLFIFLIIKSPESAKRTLGAKLENHFFFSKNDLHSPEDDTKYF